MDKDERNEEASLPEDFLAEVDRELDALQNGAEVQFDLQALPPGDHDGIEEMQTIFLEISRNTLGPISRYMKALSAGENVRDLLELSEMVVTPLISKTEEVGLTHHAEDLTFFRSLLFLALGERDPDAMFAMREVVMEGYSKLSERFGLSFRGYRLAVKNLVQFYRRLKQDGNISEMEIRKFFAIGVPSLTWVRRTKTSEMVSLSGISIEAMASIRKVAMIYRVQPTIAAANLAEVIEQEEPVDAQVFDLHNLSESDVLDSEVLTNSMRQPRGSA